MVEKDAKKDKKQRKITRLRALFALFAPFCLIYVYLAFMPTGLSRLAEQNAEALKKINATLSPPAKAPKSVNPQTPHQEKKDIFQKFEVLPDPFAFKDEGSRDLLNILFGFQEHRYRIASYFSISNRDMGMEDLQAEFRTSNPLLQEGLGRLARAYARAPSYDVKMIDHTGLVLLKTQEEALAACRISLQTVLDQLEDSLLAATPEALDFGNIPSEWRTRNSKFMMLGRLLVLRAAIRGQNDKALRLLENYLEGVRVLHLAIFPLGQEKLPGVRSLFLALGGIEDFPDEGFVRARAILERAHLGAEELAAIRTAIILTQSDAMYMVASNSEVDLSDTWDLFLDGVPGKIITDTANAMLKPIMKRRGERVLLAWAQGTPAEILAAEKQWQSPLPLQNKNNNNTPLFDVSFAQPKPHRAKKLPLQLQRQHLESIYLAKGIYFNDELDLTLLVLAAAHYRHKTGQYPEALSDLSAEYLDSQYQRDSFPNTPETRAAPGLAPALLTMYTQPPFQRPQFPRAMPGKPDPKMEAYAKAREAHDKKHKRYPRSAEDLRPFAANEAEMEDFKTRFKAVPGQTVFFLFRLDPAYKNLRYEFRDRGQTNSRDANEEELKDIERRMSGPPEALDTKFYWPEEPLISKELMVLLK